MGVKRELETIINAVGGFARLLDQRDKMEVILLMLILIGMGLFAFGTFILAQYKEEIWEAIIFDESK